MKLLQLPIPEVEHLYTLGNIPLAAAYLKGFSIKEGLLEADQIEILPREIINIAGDRLILDLLLKEETRLIGFTCYMWNIQRNLLLAQRIKSSRPDISIVFGGPEITLSFFNSSLFSASAVDTVVIGEGELPFMDLLKDFKQRKPLKRMYQSDTPLDLSRLPNPYLERILVPVAGESIYLETMRGCPYPCKYCFYSKSYSGMRYFPPDDLSNLFELARNCGVPEIYFMDPSFNVTPGLEEKLERIRKLNTTAIAIHTETRLEGITPEIARLMKEAGIKSVEAGLQSTNKPSLKAIARDWNRGKFIQGAQLLKNVGIDVKTGVILGLPYDGPKEFENTLDLVMQLELEESMEIYPLSLIPGTKLRDEAETFNISFMPHPPYWVTETAVMDEGLFKQTIEMVEHKLGIEFFPAIVPQFNNTPAAGVDIDVTTFLDLRKNALKRISEFNRFITQVGHSLTLLIDNNTPFPQLLELGRWLQRETPYTLVQLVLDMESLPLTAQLAPLKEAFFYQEHYFNHIHYFKMDCQEIYSLRFFHLTANLETALEYLRKPMACDLVLRFSPRLLQEGLELLEAKPILWVDSAISIEQLERVKQLYQGFENFLILPSAVPSIG